MTNIKKLNRLYPIEYSAWLSIKTRCYNKNSIDRINVNGNYEPGNVRWATLEEQGRNKRNNVLITAFGKTMCIAEWAEKTGKSYFYLHNHLIRSKKNPETILC